MRYTRDAELAFEYVDIKICITDMNLESMTHKY